MLQIKDAHTFFEHPQLKSCIVCATSGTTVSGSNAWTSPRPPHWWGHCNYSCGKFQQNPTLEPPSPGHQTHQQVAHLRNAFSPPAAPVDAMLISDWQPRWISCKFLPPPSHEQDKIAMLNHKFLKQFAKWQEIISCLLYREQQSMSWFNRRSLLLGFPCLLFLWRTCACR